MASTSSEIHVYQYSFKIPVKQSYSDIHTCIQMPMHHSSSQFSNKIKKCIYKKKNKRDAPIRGDERTWQILWLGSAKNPNTFQQQMCI